MFRHLWIEFSGQRDQICQHFDVWANWFSMKLPKFGYYKKSDIFGLLILKHFGFSPKIRVWVNFNFFTVSWRILDQT